MKSGRFKAYYQLGYKRYRPGKTFSTKRLAQLWLDQERRLYELDMWTPPAQRQAEEELKRQAEATTLNEFAEPWIEARTTSSGNPLAPSTKKLYRKYLCNRLAPLADMRLQEITEQVVAQWWEDNAEHRPDRQQSYAFLKCLLEEAMERGLIESNPCKVKNASRRARNTSKKQRGMMINTVTVEDVQAMLNDYDRPHFRLVLQLCAWCGLRIGEALALTTKDFRYEIDPRGLPCWHISITKTVADNEGNGRIIKDPKTEDSNREIVAPPHLDEAIRQHLATIEPGALLFPSTNPAMAYATIEQVKGTKTVRTGGRVELTGWCAVREQHGYPKLRIHDLRHWARTIWTRAGLDGASVEMMLGHQLPEVQGTYAHLDITHLWNVAPKVSELAGWHNPTKQAMQIDPRMLANMAPEALQAMTGDQLAANTENLKQALLMVTRARLERDEGNSSEQKGRQAQ